MARSYHVEIATFAANAEQKWVDNLLSRFDVAAGYSGLVVGMVLMGIGLGLFQPASVTDAVKADSQGRKSLAGGLVLMFQFVGGAIGLGLTTSIVASSQHAAVSDHLASLSVVLPAAQRDALDSMLAGTASAQRVLAQFDPAVGQRLLTIAGDAFAAGVQAGLRLDAVIVAIGAVLAVVFLGRVKQAAPRPTVSRPVPRR